MVDGQSQLDKVPSLAFGISIIQRTEYVWINGVYLYIYVHYILDPGPIPEYSWILLRTMCDNAWQWAQAHKLWRKNPIHKEEECRLVIDDEFKWNLHQSQGTDHSGQFQMEVGVVMVSAGFYFNGRRKP